MQRPKILPHQRMNVRQRPTKSSRSDLDVGPTGATIGACASKVHCWGSPWLSPGHDRDSRGHRATYMRVPAALTTRSCQRSAEHVCSRPRTPAPARAHNTIVDAGVRMESCEMGTQQRAAGSHRTACTSNGGQARGDRDAPYLEVERHRPQEFMRRPCRLRRAACTSATAAAEHTEASEQWQRRPRAATRQNASAE